MGKSISASNDRISELSKLLQEQKDLHFKAAGCYRSASDREQWTKKITKADYPAVRWSGAVPRCNAVEIWDPPVREGEDTLDVVKVIIITIDDRNIDAYHLLGGSTVSSYPLRVIVSHKISDWKGNGYQAWEEKPIGLRSWFPYECSCLLVVILTEENAFLLWQNCYFLLLFLTIFI